MAVVIIQIQQMCRCCEIGVFFVMHLAKQAYITFLHPFILICYNMNFRVFFKHRENL